MVKTLELLLLLKADILCYDIAINIMLKNIAFIY